MLTKCVESILSGSLRPDELIIVGRVGDKPTERAIARIQAGAHDSVSICSAWVSEPGHIPPVERGLRAASGDLVAVVDDDVTVTSGWLSSLVAHFSDSSIGAVGGRVLLPGIPVRKPKGNPGCVSWYGKQWGNLGSLSGPGSYEVDAVMEGNCMWRREVLASLNFDPVLNFDDGSMYGLDLCLQAKERGFKVVYEPGAVVFHDVAPRVPELDRHERGPRIFSYCRNYTYIVLKRLPLWRRLVFLFWWFLIGERDAWGVASLVFDTVDGDWRKNRHVKQAWAGKVEGLRLSLQRGWR